MSFFKKNTPPENTSIIYMTYHIYFCFTLWESVNTSSKHHSDNNASENLMHKIILKKKKSTPRKIK